MLWNDLKKKMLLLKFPTKCINIYDLISFICLFVQAHIDCRSTKMEDHPVTMPKRIISFGIIALHIDRQEYQHRNILESNRETLWGLVISSEWFQPIGALELRSMTSELKIQVSVLTIANEWIWFNQSKWIFPIYQFYNFQSD